MLFRSNDTATTEIYTLSLHDALPISNMKVDLTKANSTLQASILGLKISDRIALSTLPSVAPNSSNDQLIEGWTETWGAESVIFDYNTSPASTGTVWVLDSASFSQLDSTTRLAY